MEEAVDHDIDGEIWDAVNSVDRDVKLILRLRPDVVEPKIDRVSEGVNLPMDLFMLNRPSISGLGHPLGLRKWLCVGTSKC